jgi:IS30 family transposase
MACLRRYIPKGTDLSVHSHAYLNNSHAHLNKH